VVANTLMEEKEDSPGNITITLPELKQD